MKVARRRYAAAAAVVSLISLSSCRSVPDEAAAQQPDRTLEGAIDLHAHHDPDTNRQRAIDVIDLAELAKDRGMRGFVIKQHYYPTAGQAYLARKVVPGVEVFGALVLNRSMGGINPAAIEQFALVKGGWGRVVFMPTWDAEHFVRGSNQPNAPIVPVSRNGELLPEVKDVIALIAKTKTRDSNAPLVLATGHSSPAESLMMVREARRVGLQHVVVTHPAQDFIGMTVEQMQEAARLGAFIEFMAGTIEGDESESALREAAEAIRKVGPESVVISTDLGQPNRPLHPDGLAAFAAGLRRHGFNDRELATMMKDNPAQVLGLSAPGQPSAAQRP